VIVEVLAELGMGGDLGVADREVAVKQVVAQPVLARAGLHHGATAEEAFFACTFLEENAQIQLQAEIMGGAIPLSEDEARDCAAGTFNPRLFALLWTFYENKVRLG
jgi:ribulose-5-phosphate 4-epimerase/fuculose-1-phosphate aldolase